MTNRKTVGERLAGYAKSERVEAKFFLFGMAPVVPLIISDELGWPRGSLWTVWAVLSVAWFIVIVGVGLVGALRAFRRSLRGKRNGN
ncbi:hypothetical protein DAH66_06835 [Sphingomonas koreensis]|uniref:Uncharacterized protein n=2 Tax=Sphingomonas koreensis TaxID=93064 RepID=A0A430G6M5_9SPHN|nr:hypothetical protein DAH66_06835 [Sphingomonas koreensis]